MVEETLTGTPPILGGHSKPNNGSQAPANRQAEVKHGTNARAAAQPTGRKQRLKIHLAIGSVMAAAAIAGYILLGPRVSANAAEVANHQLVNVSASSGRAGQPYNLNPGMTGGSTVYNMAALNAEMEEITRQITALKAANALSSSSYNAGGSQSTQGFAGNGGFSGNSSDQLQATLEQMMAETHEMMAKMEAIQGPGNGTGSSSHSGHH